MTGSACAADSGDRKSVIIMFFNPVTTEDLNYLEATGGLIKYTNSIIHGVAIDMPVAALDRLRSMKQNPSSPLCDPVVKNISFIVDDGMAYPFEAGTATEEPAMATQPLPESTSPAITGPVGAAFGLLPGNMFAFPVLPLAVNL